MSRVMTHAQWEAHQRLFGRDREPHPAQQPIPLGVVLLTVPLPPSVNQLYGVGENGQKFLLPEQKIFRNDVIGTAHIAMRGAEPLTGRLEVWMRLHFSNRRRSDISNRIKALEDAMTHARVYKDDSQIDALHIERVVDPNGQEFCTVEIRERA